MTELRNFHVGEAQLQASAGIDTADYDARVDQPFQPELNASEVRFVGKRTFSVAASVDADGRPWASPLIGMAGELLVVEDLTTVRITPRPVDGDPLIENLRETGHMGVLYFDPSIRRRAKSLGTGIVGDDGAITYRMHRMFGLCPKYIYKRDHQPSATSPGQGSGAASIADELSDDDSSQLRASDTVFLASFSEAHGADPTHRGGPAGFITVVNSTTVSMPDYHGNGMFQTLGNLVLDDRIGLTSVDFSTGRVLQLTGTGAIEEREPHGATSSRSLVISISEVRVGHVDVGEWTDIEAFDLDRVGGN